VSDAEAQHAHAEALLDEIVDAVGDEERFHTLLNELTGALLQHIDIEEGDVFAAARKLFDEEEAMSMADDIDEAKRETKARLEESARRA